MINDCPPKIISTPRDEFETGELIGRGSTAAVYYGRSTLHGTPCAIKVFGKRGTSDSPPANRQAFRSEILVMRTITHKNTVQLYDYGEDPENLYLMVEICEKGDLFTKLEENNGPYSHVRVVTFMQQLFSALEYIHSIGISHGDIKPENLLVGMDGQIRLADFGCSIHYPAGTTYMTRIAMGTHGYRAPEVVSGNIADPEAADMWACGVTLFVLIAGEYPFLNENNVRLDITSQAFVSKYLENDPKLADVNVDIRRLLRELLQVDPKDRMDPATASDRCLKFIDSSMV